MPTTHSSRRDPTGIPLFPGAGWRSSLRTGYVTAQTRAPFVLCFCGSYGRWVSLRPSSPFLPPDLCSSSSGWCPKFFPPASPLLVVSFQTCWLSLVPFGKHLARGTVWVEARPNETKVPIFVGFHSDVTSSLVLCLNNWEIMQWLPAWLFLCR